MDQVGPGLTDMRSTGSMDLIHSEHPDPQKIFPRCINRKQLEKLRFSTLVSQAASFFIFIFGTYRQVDWSISLLKKCRSVDWFIKFVSVGIVSTVD